MRVDPPKQDGSRGEGDNERSTSDDSVKSREDYNGNSAVKGGDDHGVNTRGATVGAGESRERAWLWGRRQ